MSLLDHDFDGEYDIMLSVWGEGELNEEALLPMQRPDAVFLEYKKKHCLRSPKSISLLLEDPTSVGCNYFYTGISTALLEKLTVLKELVLPDTVTNIEVTPKIAEIFKKKRYAYTRIARFFCGKVCRRKRTAFQTRRSYYRGVLFRAGDGIHTAYAFVQA